MSIIDLVATGDVREIRKAFAAAVATTDVSRVLAELMKKLLSPAIRSRPARPSSQTPQPPPT